MSDKRIEEPASNVEWEAWGKRDPLFAVATWPGKEKGGPSPWTNEEFYLVGEWEWNECHSRWREYGIDYEACGEIGCGAGRITKQLARHFRSVHGVDVSPEMLDYARAQVPDSHVTFHRTTGSNLPLKDQSLSAVFSCHVFQHFDSLEVAHRYFVEIARVLRPGGTLMIHLPVHAWPRGARLHEGLHWFWGSLGRAKASVNRVLIKAGRFRPVMRMLSFPMDWLFSELPRIGFQRLEVVFIQQGDAGKPTAFLLARKP